MSGVIASIPDGGGGTWIPIILSIIQAPRITGEVVVPLAVTLKTLACVISPPRGESFGSSTLRNLVPSNGFNLYNFAKRSFTNVKSELTKFLAGRSFLINSVKKARVSNTDASVSSSSR